MKIWLQYRNFCKTNLIDIQNTCFAISKCARLDQIDLILIGHTYAMDCKTV